LMIHRLCRISRFRFGVTSSSSPSFRGVRIAGLLLVIGTDGKGTMTNYRVQQQTYIVDRLFDRARLVLGNGKKAQKVEISRAGKG
jgi:hypothetical protein